MTILNLDGAAIFGPGSEWLWTFAQFLALAITGLAIYRQLRAQAWANQFALLSRIGDQFSSEKMIRTKLSALIEVAGGARRLTPSINEVGRFFDDLAAARFHGHVRARYAWEEYRHPAQGFWAVFAPLLPEMRKANPNLWEDWERWLVEIRERDRQAGKTEDFSPERMVAWIAEAIEYYIDRLRIEEEMRRGVIPTWPGPAAPLPQGSEPPATGT